MPLRITSPDANQLQCLLPELRPEASAELAAVSRQVTYKSGEAVMGEREPWTPAVVADGTIRLTIRSHDGREATLRHFGRGVVFGLVSIFDPNYSSPMHERTMMAVERSTAIFLDASMVLRVCHRYPGFAIQLLRGTVEWGGALSDAAGRYAFMTVRQRLADHLLSIAVADSDGRLIAPGTQQQLANAIGSVREVVARTLGDLSQEGFILASRGKVAIVDRDALGAIAVDVT